MTTANKDRFIQALKDLTAYLEDEETTLDGCPDSVIFEVEYDITELGAGEGGYFVKAPSGHRYYRINFTTFNRKHSNIAEAAKQLK